MPTMIDFSKLDETVDDFAWPDEKVGQAFPSNVIDLRQRRPDNFERLSGGNQFDVINRPAQGRFDPMSDRQPEEEV